MPPAVAVPVVRPLVANVVELRAPVVGIGTTTADVATLRMEEMADEAEAAAEEAAEEMYIELAADGA